MVYLPADVRRNLTIQNKRYWFEIVQSMDDVYDQRFNNIFYLRTKKITLGNIENRFIGLLLDEKYYEYANADWDYETYGIHNIGSTLEEYYIAYGFYNICLNPDEFIDMMTVPNLPGKGRRQYATSWDKKFDLIIQPPNIEPYASDSRHYPVYQVDLNRKREFEDHFAVDWQYRTTIYLFRLCVFVEMNENYESLIFSDTILDQSKDFVPPFFIRPFFIPIFDITQNYIPEYFDTVIKNKGITDYIVTDYVFHFSSKFNLVEILEKPLTPPEGEEEELTPEVLLSKVQYNQYLMARIINTNNLLHQHDDLYYQKTEVNDKFSEKMNLISEPKEGAFPKMESDGNLSSTIYDETYLEEPEQLVYSGEAGINIAKNKVVTLGTDNRIYIADNTDVSHMYRIIGFSYEDTIMGETVKVIRQGSIIDPTWGTIDINKEYYLTTNGEITKTKPTSGFVKRMGVFINSVIFFVQQGEPIEV